jgi:hypothetical protein
VAKRLSRSAWLRAPHPNRNGKKIESAWLDEHWGYGGLIHENAAAALTEGLSRASSRDVGYGLYFKLFAEYANALEVAGAWGWALRTRRQHPLLLDAFLTYPDSAPRTFYNAARLNRSGSLILLLKLPPEPKVLAALHATIADWTEEECRRSLAEAVVHAKFLAGRYFSADEIIRATYNRAKHGATILHQPSLSPREFYVIAPHLDVTGPRDPSRYDLPKFTVNSKMINSLNHGVRIASAMIKYLAGLATALDDAGLLYPRRRRV